MDDPEPIVMLEGVPALDRQVTHGFTKMCVVTGDTGDMRAANASVEADTEVHGNLEVFGDVVADDVLIHVGEQSIRCWRIYKAYFEQSVCLSIRGN